MKSYFNLKAFEKFIAILACLKQPTTIELALDLGEILELTEEQIKEVTSSHFIEHRKHDEFGDLFWVKPELQSLILEQLDVGEKSVHEQIANKMLKDLGMDELYGDLK